MAAAASLLFALSARTTAQDTDAADGIRPQTNALRCPAPETPRGRHFECNTAEPDLERTLLPDLRRIRRDLATLGITPTFSYTGAYFGNTSNAPREGSYGGGLHAAVHLDFGKLLDTQGLSAYVDLWWMQASNPHAIAFTNLFPASSNFVGNGFWIGQIYLQQQFASQDLTIAAGRLGPGATFATLPVFANYSSAAINANPRSVELNEPPFAPPPPGSQWGIQALYHFTPVWEGALGIYNNNPNAAAGKGHGLDWGWRAGNEGTFAIAQINWLRNQGSKDTGMPGQYSIGSFWDGNDFPAINATTPSQKHNRGLYLMAQQQLTRPRGAGRAQGLTIWGTATASRRQSINPLPLFAAAGASYEGPLASRPDDIASIGWYYGKPSHHSQPATTHSQAVELFYQYTISPAVNLVLDAQCIFRVNANPSPAMAVLGAQFEVAF